MLLLLVDLVPGRSCVLENGGDLRSFPRSLAQLPGLWVKWLCLPETRSVAGDKPRSLWVEAKAPRSLGLAPASARRLWGVTILSAI